MLVKVGKAAARGESYQVLAILYCMVALDTQISETKDRLDESLQADYLCFSRAPSEMLLDSAPAFFRIIPLPSSKLPSDR